MNPVQDDVRIGPAQLPGLLERVPKPVGVVVFVHGSGSSRLSPRNREVAGVLRGMGLDTLLFDLLTEDEALDRSRVFDIALLAERTIGALAWLQSRPDVAALPIGLFGASTGAAAALVAAVELPGRVAAIVARGGRVDLAGARLASVRAPTLLIVGGADPEILRLNRLAMPLLSGPKRLEIVPGATHLFEEPGALDATASLAGAWFLAQLPARRLL